MGRWLKRILIVVVGLLIVGYFGIPYLVQTSWAREKVKKALEEKTGRKVEVGAIGFGWTSGLTVNGVTVHQKSEAQEADGPLFQLGALRFDLGLGDLLKRTIRVTEFTVEKPRIVIIRDREGRFNFSDLLPTGEGTSSSGSSTKVVARLDISKGTVLYIDEGLGTRVEAQGIDAKSTWNQGKLAVDMSCDLNGGQVRLSGTSDFSRTPAPFQVKEFRIDGAKFDSDLAALGLFLPLAGDAPQQASGTLSFDLENVSGTGLTLENLKKTLSAAGKIRLSGGALVSGPVTQLYSALNGIGAGDLSVLGAGSDTKSLTVRLLSSTFTIADGKVQTKDMKLDAAGLTLKLSGSTSLGGDLDYEVVAENLGDLLAKNEKVAQYLGGQNTIPLSLKGTLASPEVTVDLEGAVKGAIENQIRDRIKDKLPGGIKLPIPGGK